MWTLIKNNPWKTFFIALAATYVIISLVKRQWNPMKWFSTNGGSRRQCIKVNQITGGCSEWKSIT